MYERKGNVNIPGYIDVISASTSGTIICGGRRTLLDSAR
jgi:hypothetical protein